MNLVCFFKVFIRFFYFFSGLCTILRSEAGGQEERFEGETSAAAGDYCNNAHWLGETNAQASNYVAYYDATSLYPSSGKYILFLMQEKERKGKERNPP